MNNFKLKSNPEQILDYLNNTKIRNWNLEDIKTEIILKFDLFELFELVSYSYQNNNLKTIINSLDEVNLYPIYQKSFRKLKDSQTSLNTPDFMALLIGHKLEMIKKHNINIDSYLQQIDCLILEIKLLLGEMKFETFSINEVFGLFFIYEKDKALNIFSNFISKLFSERSKDQIYIHLSTKLHSFFSILNLNFIPTIQSENFKTFENVENKDEKFVSKLELIHITKENIYLSKTFPLKEIDQNLLLTNENYQDKSFCLDVLQHYFKFILNDKFEFNRTNVFSIFISNLTDKYPKFDSLELIQARIILVKFFNMDSNKEKFLAIFCILYEQEKMLNISNKLPFLLNSYFGNDYYTQNTIKQALIIPAKRSKQLQKEIKNAIEWYANENFNNQLIKHI